MAGEFRQLSPQGVIRITGQSCCPTNTPPDLSGAYWLWLVTMHNFISKPDEFRDLCLHFAEIAATMSFRDPPKQIDVTAGQ